VSIVVQFLDAIQILLIAFANFIFLMCEYLFFVLVPTLCCDID